MGLFVTFEGIEGSGKTTQIRMAADYLKKEGVSCVMTGEPGGTPLGGELRKILLDKTALALSGMAELLLFAADRAQHVEETIIPAMEAGAVVLCDRFSDATLAYQGYGRGQDIRCVRELCNFSSHSLIPDMTFLFDISTAIGLDRITERAHMAGDAPREDRFERERLQFHDMVRGGYLALARQEPGRFRVIDASGAADEVHREVIVHLKKLLNER